MNMQRFGMAAVAVFVVFGLVYYGAMLVFDEQYRALFNDWTSTTSRTWSFGSARYSILWCSATFSCRAMRAKA